MLRDAVLVFRFQAKPVDDDDTLKLNKSDLYTIRSSVVLLYITYVPLRQNHNDWNRLSFFRLEDLQLKWDMVIQ